LLNRETGSGRHSWPGIRQAEQRFTVAHPFVRVRGNPDADRHPYRTTGFSEVVGRHSPENPFREVARLGAGGLRQQDDELLATVAGDNVDRTLLPLQQVGQLLEHPVTH
jgi:hypothetical protein